MKTLSLLLCSAFLCSAAGAADIAVAGKIGTLGVGAEVTTALAPAWNARFGLNAASWDHNTTRSDVRYDADLRLRSFTALADWHPLQDNFRISAGLTYNGNEVKLRGRPSGNVTIGTTTFTPAEIGRLDGKLDFKKAAPYFGIGWGNALAKERTWSFTADLGVLYQQKPRVSLSATCGTALSAPRCAELQTETAIERQQLQDDVSDYRWYPVVSVGVSYRF